MLFYGSWDDEWVVLRAKASCYVFALDFNC